MKMMVRNKNYAQKDTEKFEEIDDDRQIFNQA
jgi:hypothetical protein